MSPALAGGFLTTEPPGKPQDSFLPSSGKGGWGEGTPLPSKGVTGHREPHRLAHPVSHTFSGEAEEGRLFSE